MVNAAEIEAALLYAVQHSSDPVIIQVDVSKSAFKNLKPDYDDASDVIGVDISELEEMLSESIDFEDYPDLENGIHVGMKIEDDDLAREIEDAIEHMRQGGERPLPFSLDIDVNNELVAIPYVMMSIDGPCDDIELYANEPNLIYNEDGEPYLMSTQNQEYCVGGKCIFLI